MTVSELIEALFAIPNQDAIVQVQSAVGGTGSNLLTVEVTTAAVGTFPLDAPEAEYGADGGAYTAGVVELRDVA